jgi:hypothetical protein
MALFAGLAVGARPAAVQAANPCGPPVVNPVACENTLPGNPSTDWDVSGSGDPSIQGFSTDISVNKGGTISFKISTPARAYTIGIFRFGYYQGNGARKVAAISPSATLPQNQPACLTDVPTGLVDCGNWAVSASWTVPSTAVSGVYMAVLIRTDTGGASQIPFVVRDDASHSDMLFQTDDTTWEAYNQYGGNSLYLGSAPTSDGRAYKVSYNRPFATRGQTVGYGTSDFFFYAEYPMIRFLEANGYDLSYSTGIDADRRGALIQNHKILVTAGHDEYWSAGMRSNVEAARNAGVNIAFFTGNEVFWKVRFENSIDGSGTSYRTLVCYKETKSSQPLDPADPPTWTGTWRDPTLSPPADGGRPENALNGTIFTVNRGSAAITVPAAYSKLRIWRNTSIATLSPGQTATFGTNTLGYEWDEDLDNGFRPAGLFDLSSTTVSVPEHILDYGNNYGPATVTHHLTMYRAPSGALVFGAGTVQWAWGLDVNHDTSPDVGPSTPDVRMQQMTVNLLADMGVQPATLMSGLVATSASTDTTPPTSTITAPAAGSTFAPGSSVTISGTAADADAGGGVVAGVEVSVDGGTSWHPATGTTSWTYTWKPLRAGPATIRSRAVDDSGRLETPGPGFGVTVSGTTSQPLFVAQSTVTNGLTVNAPAGVVNGDVLVATLEVDADPATVTGPGGWTMAVDVATGNGSGGRFHAQVWYKVAGASEPTSYSWGVPGGVWVDIGVLDYAYVNTASPIDAIAARDAGTTSAPTTPAISTGQANDMVMAGFVNYNTISFTAGSGMTQRYNFDSNTAQDAVQAAAGTTGTRTATSSAPGPTAALILALKPGSADTIRPVVTMTAPGAGATVSGNVTVSASATDNVGVAWVQFQLDGANLGPRLTTAPYAMSWASASVANGGHSLGAVAADAAGNQGSATPVAVTVNNVPPVISNIASGSPTTTTATITWATDTAASSQVDYGTTNAYGSSTTLGSTLVTSHSQVVSGLQPATTYHFRVRSANANGASASGDNTFITATPPPPVISNTQVSSVTSSGATVTWTTDTAADSTVLYGTTTSYGASASSASLVNSHSLSLSALSSSTTYHYQVQSKDAFGQTSHSADLTFTTGNPPPLISNIASGSPTTSGTTITWNTDVAASSQVDYGTTSAYGSSTALDGTLITSHSQVVSGLQPGTTYHFRVRSADGSGNIAISVDNTFTTATPPPPVISNIQVSSVTSSSATVTWTTDTAADSTVLYGTTTAYGLTTSSPSLVTSHSLSLSGLTPSTTYHCQVQSKDAFGQTSHSADLSFTTAVASSPPSFRSASSVTNGTTVAKPAGAVAGDLLLATLEVDADPVTVTGPSGWTLLMDTPAAIGTGSDYHAQVWYRVAGASEPASYTWTVPGGVWVDIGILDYVGVNATTPVDAFNGRYAGNVTSASTNAVTTSQANEMVVALFINYNSATWTAGSAMTKRYDFDANAAEDAVQAAGGSTGARSMTASGSGPITAQIVTLRAK